MKLYLDNCCFNRPYDDQSVPKIKSETEAIILILDKIITEEVELVWSYILDYENSMNPFVERKNAIAKWKEYSQIEIVANEDLLDIAEEVRLFNVSPKDCLHVASAVIASCDYFITTDVELLRKLKKYYQINLLGPAEYLILTKRAENDR
ncbi:MAG: PIN domain protein [Ignavibacteria bacterium]